MLQRLIERRVDRIVRRFRRVERRSNHDYDFAFRLGIGIERAEFGKRADDTFFVQLGELPCHGGLPASEPFAQSLERIHKPRSALIQHQGGPDGRDLGDRIAPRLGLRRKKAEEEEAVGRKSGKRQRRNRGGWTWHRMHCASGLTRRANQLVTGVGDERRASIAHQRDGLVPEQVDDPLAIGFARMIVVTDHRDFGADVGKQFRSDSRILDQDPVGAAKCVRGARREIAQIADWGGDDVQAWRKRLTCRRILNKLFQFKQIRVIVATFIGSPGEVAMILLVAVSAISLTGLQATINAPRQAFTSCLKEATSKASSEKVGANGYDAYARNACSAELGSFKAAVVKFDMGNKMSRKASDEDADAMIGDFMSSSVDRYKYVTGASSAATQAAVAVAKPTTVTPQPTPASAPQPPK